MAPSPYHRDDSVVGETSTRYGGAAPGGVTPESAATSSSPSLSLSIPSTMQSSQQPVLSPTTYALTQKPILLNTPDSDKVCRPVASLQTSAAKHSSSGVSSSSNNGRAAGFDIDLGIQNMTLLKPTSSSTDTLCKPVRNTNVGEHQRPLTCTGTCSLVKGPLVLLDTPDKDTICRPTSPSPT